MRDSSQFQMGVLDDWFIVRIIVFGAHPDDCEVKCGGTAIRWAKEGHAVKFVSMTDGRSGHHRQQGEEIVLRRAKEAEEARRRLGIAAYDILPIPDGNLEPSIEARNMVIRQIRQWNADIVITHRPNDYHPDHRYTSTLVQDSAYLVLVPNVCPGIEPLRTNPVYLYMQDHFERPYAFQPSVAVDIGGVWKQKLRGLDAHVSQFYEWLPWISGELESVPPGADAREEWLAERWGQFPQTQNVLVSFRRRYAEKGDGEIYAEAFELCEYGHQLAEADLWRLFPL